MYEALTNSQEEFRLLTLHPSQDESRPVVCSLKKHVLHAEHDYEALSYCWGNSQDTGQIVLGDQPFAVTLNLWHALNTLRLRDMERTLWIDALCINQADLEEKVGQLRVMGELYKRAKSVVIWLGMKHDDDPGFEPFKEVIKSVGETDAVSFVNLAEKTLEDCGRFFSNPWWTRIWVIQEVVLSRSAVFQLGTDRFSLEQLLDAFLKFAAAFQKHYVGASIEFFAGNAAKVMDLLKAIRIVQDIRASDIVQDTMTTQLSAKALTMLWICYANELRDREASIARDQLYGLYGMLPPEVAQTEVMKPSYTVTTEEAFTRTTFGLIKSTQSLMVFNYLASNEQGSSNIPSWVPDWRLSGSKSRDPCLRAKREELVNAAHDTSFALQLLGGNTLCLKGFLVDVISNVYTMPIAPNTSFLLEVTYQNWLEDWKAECGQDLSERPVIDREHAISGFMRVMCRDCQPCSETDQLEPLTQSKFLEMFYAHDRACNSAMDHGTVVLDQPVLSGKGEDKRTVRNLADAYRNRENYPEKTNVDQDSKATNHLIDCVMNQVFFLTVGGSIGLAERNIRTGDHIFIVAGNSHPVVLRPSKTYANTWTAVSECHTSQWMHGQAVSGIETCNEFADTVSDMEAVQTMKGTLRNPRWDELDPSSLEEGWSYLLVE